MTESRERKAAKKHGGRTILLDKEIEALPPYTVVHDQDGDVFVKTSDGSWSEVDGETGCMTEDMQRYCPLIVLSNEMFNAPASDERLLSLARKVVDAYADNDDPALTDAMISLSVELSTLEVR